MKHQPAPHPTPRNRFSSYRNDIVSPIGSAGRLRAWLGLWHALLPLALVLFFSVQVLSGIAHASDAGIARFFRMGDGQLHIRSNKTGREVNVQLLNADGSANSKALAEVDAVFGFPAGRDDHVSLRLLFMLDYFTDLVAKGKLIRLESGYRSPEYNLSLRNAGGIVAPTSTHIDAMAIDFSMAGVNGKELWEIIRHQECCGVGHYGGATIHLDSGRPRFWEAATAKVDSGQSDLNRRIYLSTDYDRYRAGESIRLALSSVSNYQFGVKRSVALVKDGQADQDNPIEGLIQADDECIAVNKRADGRGLTVSLPPDATPGRYRIRMSFCRIPFPQMPAEILSNPIEIVNQ